jgi:hypothetical protein
MNGILTIYPLGSRQDWQRTGFHGNKGFGIKHVPKTNLLPFFFDVPAAATSCILFKAQQISTLSVRETKIAVQEVTLDTGLITYTAGVYSNRFKYVAGGELAGITQGIWQFYIKLNDNTEWISELMNVPVSSEMLTNQPDFNNDFNIDFNI